MVAERQAEERDDEPADEQQVAERGQALLEPVASAVMRRAEPAHAAEGGSVTHGAPPARYRARPRRSRGSDRKSVVEGKSVAVRVDPGGRRIIKKKKKNRK